MDSLLQTLMKIVLENAGAEKGFLLSKKDEQFHIAAKGSINSPDILMPRALPVKTDSSSLLPLSIINLVKRTQKSLVQNG